MFDRALGYRSMLLFCRSLMVGGFDRDDIRSGFGLSIYHCCFCRSLVVGGFDRDDVRSGFEFSIDIDVLSIAGGGGFVGVASALPNRGDVRSGFGLSISLDRLKLKNRAKLCPCVR
jgi:hypothetical protein